jgi:hypothetical protein
MESLLGGDQEGSGAGENLDAGLAAARQLFHRGLMTAPELAMVERVHAAASEEGEFEVTTSVSTRTFGDTVEIAVRRPAGHRGATMKVKVEGFAHMLTVPVPSHIAAGTRFVVRVPSRAKGYRPPAASSDDLSLDPTALKYDLKCEMCSVQGAEEKWFSIPPGHKKAACPGCMWVGNRPTYWVPPPET